MKKKKQRGLVRRRLNAVLLIIMAIAILTAIAPWNTFVNTDPNYRGLNLYSFFTVQSNIIAAVTFLLGAIALLRDKSWGAWFGMLRGGAVIYMVVTGLVYALLLQDNPAVHSALGFDWDNFVLHQLTPIFIVGEWLLWPPRDAVSPKRALIWLVFPFLWLVYTLVRADFTNWYPYPFLDPAEVGSGGVVAYIAGIALGFLLLSQIAAWISRERARGHIGAS